MTVVFDRNFRVFNRPGETLSVALEISKTFDRVLQAGLL